MCLLVLQHSLHIVRTRYHVLSVVQLVKDVVDEVEVPDPTCQEELLCFESG